MTRPTFIFKHNEPLVIGGEHQPGDTFLMAVTRHRYITLTLSEDRRLYDRNGDEYACSDTLLMKDTVSRPGVGPFSLSEDHWSSEATDAHDFQTSSRVFMESNPRSRAEDELDRRLHYLADSKRKKVVAKILSTLSRAFSWAFWDVRKTRWK